MMRVCWLSALGVVAVAAEGDPSWWSLELRVGLVPGVDHMESRAINAAGDDVMHRTWDLGGDPGVQTALLARWQRWPMADLGIAAEVGPFHRWATGTRGDVRGTMTVWGIQTGLDVLWAPVPAWPMDLHAGPRIRLGAARQEEEGLRVFEAGSGYFLGAGLEAGATWTVAWFTTVQVVAGYEFSTATTRRPAHPGAIIVGDGFMTYRAQGPTLHFGVARDF